MAVKLEKVGELGKVKIIKEIKKFTQLGQDMRQISDSLKESL